VNVWHICAAWRHGSAYGTAALRWHEISASRRRAAEHPVARSRHIQTSSVAARMAASNKQMIGTSGHAERHHLQAYHCFSVMSSRTLKDDLNRTAWLMGDNNALAAACAI